MSECAYSQGRISPYRAAYREAMSTARRGTTPEDYLHRYHTGTGIVLSRKIFEYYRWVKCFRSSQKMDSLLNWLEKERFFASRKYNSVSLCHVSGLSPFPYTEIHVYTGMS